MSGSAVFGSGRGVEDRLMADVAVVTLGEMVAVWVNVGVLVVVGGSVTLFLLGLMGMCWVIQVREPG